MAQLKRRRLTPLADVDIRLMRVFKTVLECGGLSAAQAELGVGRSTISRQIADLETRLGLRLCDRGRSGFKPTAAGRAVADYIDIFLKAADEFTVNIASINDRLAGRVEIGVMDWSLLDEGNPLLSKVKQHRRAAPGVIVNFTVGTPSEIEKGVIEGRLDAGVVPDYHRLPGVACRPLYDETVGLFCGGDHPLAIALRGNQSIEKHEVWDHELVYRGYFEGDLLRQRKQHFIPGSIAYQTEAVMGLVQSGIALGFLPLHCSSQMRGSPVEILPDVFRYSVPINVIWRHDRERSALLASFLKHVGSK